MTTDNLQTVLNKIKKENKNTLIVGDFNFDLLNHENNDQISKFLHMMIENSFQPCILEPTRIVQGNKPSLVDNIFSNSKERRKKERKPFILPLNLEKNTKTAL